MPAVTAAAAKRQQRERAENLKALITGAQQEGQKRGRGRPPKNQARIRTINEMPQQVLKQPLRKELPADVVAQFVKVIDEIFPGLRFNREGSKEYPFDHFYELKTHKFAPGWPVMVTSSGDKYWLSPEGELIASQHNRQCKEKLE